MEDIKKDICDIILANPKYYHHKIRSKYKDLLESIYPKKPIKEQIYVFLNGNKICEICGSSDLYFLSLKDGYSKTCSKKCGYTLREQMFLEMYGVKNLAQLEETKQKNKETIKNNKNLNLNYESNIIEKRKQTCKEKYGAESYSQTDEYKIKIKQTSIEKYSTESPNQSILVKLKQKQKIIEKYGVDNISKSEEIKKKKVESCLKKYGVTHYAKTQESKLKNLENKDYRLQIIWSAEVREILLDKDKLEQELKKTTPAELAKKLGIAFSTVYKYAVEYGLRQKYINFSTELIVQNILDELELTYIKNDRNQIKPKELDFY